MVKVVVEEEVERWVRCGWRCVSGGAWMCGCGGGGWGWRGGGCVGRKVRLKVDMRG